MRGKFLRPRFVMLACFLIASASVSHAAIPNTRFSKGDIWIYEGTVAWQEGTEVKTRQMRLATQVIETFRYPRARVAVVRSFPSELAWYGDSQHPQYSLLVLTAKGLDGIGAESENHARKLAQDYPGLLQVLSARKSMMVAFPLTEGTRFRSFVKGAQPSKSLTVYQTLSPTLPDHTIVDFVPTLGVVRYVYEHHGTVSSVDVKLVQISKARKPPITKRIRVHPSSAAFALKNRIPAVRCRWATEL